MSKFQRKPVAGMFPDTYHQIFIGIDPGASGALAAINEYDKIVTLFDWPGDEIALAKAMKPFSSIKHHNISAAIEYVHAMPGQGVTSTFKFGTNYGIWRGILAAYEIPFFTVRPQQWQKEVVKKAEGKKAAVTAAGRIFPDAELYGPRGGAKDGRADALLIAHWCRRQYV